MNESFQQSGDRPMLSTGAAIALGLSAIIITAIIVGGIVFLRGAKTIEGLKQVDIQVNENTNNGEDSINIKINENGWIKSPRFGLYYSADMNAPTEFYRVGTDISETSAPNAVPVFSVMFDNGEAVITWGDVWKGGYIPGTCTENEFGEFQYGVSSTACVKGYRTWVSRISAQQTITQEDLNIFGDFVLKNNTKNSD